MGEVNVEMTVPLQDMCGDLDVLYRGEVCQLLIPQSRREYRLFEGMRVAYGDSGSILMSTYTAGMAAYIAVDEDGNTVAENLFPCAIITLGGNLMSPAFIDVLNKRIFVAPAWKAEEVGWRAIEPDPDRLAALLRHLSSSPFKEACLGEPPQKDAEH